MNDLRIRISGENVVHETVDGEVLVINLETSTYYGLRNTAAVIWNLLQANATVGEIVDAVADRYEAAREMIEHAVSGFVAELAAEALVFLATAAPSPVLANAGPSASLSTRLPFTLPRLEKFTDLRFLVSL